MSDDLYQYSPGILTQVLTRKRLEARQAMLDQLNQKNVESEIAARDENTKSMGELRAAQAEDKKYVTGQRYASQFHKGQSVGPNDISEANRLGVGGMFDPGVSPDSTAIQGLGNVDLSDETLKPLSKPEYPSPKAASFKGTPKDQEEDAQAEEILKFLDSPGAANLNPDVADAYRVQALSHKYGAIPAGAYSKPKPLPEEAIQLPNNHYIFQGKEVPSVPPGTHVTPAIQPRLPRSGGSASEGTSTIQQIEDPNHPGKMISVWVNGRKKTIEPLVAPPALTPPPTMVTPPAKQQPSGDFQLFPAKEEAAPGPQVFSKTAPPKAPVEKGITSGEVNAIRVARAAAFKGPGGTTLKTPSPEGLKGIVSAMMPIIDKLPEPWMKQDLTVKDPKSGLSLLEMGMKGLLSVDDIMKNEEQPSGEVLTPEQEAHLRRALNYALGQF